MLLACAALQLCLDAQTIDIKLVNGRDGRPVTNKWVDFGIGNITSMLTIPTGKEGIASFRLTDDNAGVNTGVANPVVKYSDNFSVHAPFALCQPHGSNYSWLAVMKFPAKEVLEKGVVSSNTCGKATATPVPGEVVVFVRPLTFWEKLKQ
jgi:hypothetical protein